MIPLERLAAHALGELDERQAEEVDEHVLGCSECAAKLERLLAMGDAVREVVRRGGTRVAVTPSMLEHMRRVGLITRTHHVARNGSVACTASADDVYILTELEAVLEGVTRVDVVVRRGDHVVRMRGLPVDRARGVVAFVMPGDVIRALESGTDEVTVLAASADGERELGTYLFNHTAYLSS